MAELISKGNLSEQADSNTGQNGGPDRFDTVGREVPLSRHAESTVSPTKCQTPPLLRRHTRGHAYWQFDPILHIAHDVRDNEIYLKAGIDSSQTPSRGRLGIFHRNGDDHDLLAADSLFDLRCLRAGFG